MSAEVAMCSAAWAQPGTPAADSATRAPESEFSAPEPLQASVEYPADASGRAEVLLELTIDPEGHPRDVAIVEGAPPFAEAAATAAAQWQFKPARLRGRNVAARIRYTVRFEPEP
ncbi:MAG TPA: TonB family protein, partial [Polyangiaceae bacterium]|nr:TonB family protein [Polyangiaceae bacterium]